MPRTIDIFQARDLAREIVEEFAVQNVQPNGASPPNTIEYIVWMANEVAIGRLSDENQANRWLGAVQWGLIILAWSTRERELDRILRYSGTDDYNWPY